MDTTLVIMAAGMGSRYGGIKQIEGMGPHNEILMDYSIHDAIEAGFTKVVFIIKKSIYDVFREVIGNRIEKKIKVEYAFQEFDTLPEFYTLPKERVKPLGTVHAMLVAKDLVHEPFAIINADDYYGKSSFVTMHNYLQTLASLPDADHKAAMIGYRLKNTISKHGTVTRGICEVEQGKLVAVKETYQIKLFEDGSIRDVYTAPEGVVLDPDAYVSMNFWGFLPSMFDRAEQAFAAFLRSLPEQELKKEYVLPALVDELLKAKELEVAMLACDAVWFGVTYPEDKQYVKEALYQLHQKRAYPESLIGA